MNAVLHVDSHDSNNGLIDNTFDLYIVIIIVDDNNNKYSIKMLDFCTDWKKGVNGLFCTYYGYHDKLILRKIQRGVPAFPAFP